MAATTSTRTRRQIITLVLDGITGEDYLAWIRDPEPIALGRDLRSLRTHTQPGSNRIDLELVWDRAPATHAEALAAAGFPLTADLACRLTEPDSGQP